MDKVKGSYILVLQLEQPLAGLQVGRLGQFAFAAGFYFYVGSAFGAGGLAARLAYHTRQKLRPHWHVDYLRAATRLREIWTVSGPERLECCWCQRLLAHPALTVPVPGFGSRDTGCRAHLFYMPRAPYPALLTRIILGEHAADQPVKLQIEIHHFDDA